MMNENPSQGVHELESGALGMIADILNQGATPAQPVQPAPDAPAAQPTAQGTPPATAPAAPVPEQPNSQPVEQPVLNTDKVTSDMFAGMFDDPTAPSGTPPAEDPVLPSDEVAPPENLTERGRNAWGELRHREKQAREFAERLKGDIARMKEAQNQFNSEREQFVNALKAKDDELTALKSKVGQMDLTRSNEFKERYDQPLAQAEANLDAVIFDEISGSDTPEGLARIREAVLAPDDQFHKFISRLGTDAQIRLTDKRREYMNVKAERALALENWETTSRSLTEQSAQENAAERAMVRKRHADAAIAFNTSTIPLEYRPLVLTDEFYVDDVSTANKAFADFMQTATEEKIARAAHLGYLMPVMSRALAQALAQARQYQEQYYVARGLMKPGMATTSAPPKLPPIQPQKPAEPNRPIESVADQLDRRNEQMIAQILG